MPLQKGARVERIQVQGGSGLPEDDDQDQLGKGGQVQVNALDSLLDEIDAVLEENAEAFVQGFIQKGGE